MSSEHTIPDKEDMKDVVYWAARCAELTEQLCQAQDALRDAWSRVPADTEILRAPYRADMAVHCHICDRMTHWRTGRGLAQCKNDCNARVASRRLSKSTIPDALWELLNATEPAEESLDDE